jgi:hypothetical protein
VSPALLVQEEKVVYEPCLHISDHRPPATRYSSCSIIREKNCSGAIYTFNIQTSTAYRYPRLSLSLSLDLIARACRHATAHYCVKE